jgi:hypothetical protein
VKIVEIIYLSGTIEPFKNKPGLNTALIILFMIYVLCRNIAFWIHTKITTPDEVNHRKIPGKSPYICPVVLEKNIHVRRLRRRRR